MNWFSELFGFNESEVNDIRDFITCKEGRISSKVNRKSYELGKFKLLSLEELRHRNCLKKHTSSAVKFNEKIADAKDIHLSRQHARSVIQVASQFNLLEMVSPYITPEAGVSIYENDYTQGPACAISCGAGTVYRNYFIPVNGKIGQSANNQINCLDEIEKWINEDERILINLKNGYAFCNKEALSYMSTRINSLLDEEREILKGKLKVGVQWNTQVTASECTHLVSQVYCSAVPLGYSHEPKELWEPIARLVLEATYEAVFFVAIENMNRGGSKELFLTKVGGGVFSNPNSWIYDAIENALNKFKGEKLDVFLVNYMHSDHQVNELKKKLNV